MLRAPAGRKREAESSQEAATRADARAVGCCLTERFTSSRNATIQLGSSPAVAVDSSRVNVPASATAKRAAVRSRFGPSRAATREHTEHCMHLDLTDEDAGTLRELLHDYLPELRREVARTDAREMRLLLLKRQELVERLLARLEHTGA